MIYITKRNNEKFYKKTLFKIIFVLSLILLLSFFNFTQTILFKVTNPLFGLGSSFYKFSPSFFSFFVNKNKLVEENENLKDELTRISLINNENTVLKEENSRLLKMLDLEQDNNLINALVLAKYPQVLLDTLIINKGSSEFIKEGDLVFSQSRVLIGNIVKVSNSNAVVALNSFPDKISYAYVTRTGEPVDVYGIGGGMNSRLPMDFDLVVGDTLEVRSPYSYLIGNVEVIEENKSAGYKNVLIQNPINVRRLGAVYVTSLYEENI